MASEGSLEIESVGLMECGRYARKCGRSVMPQSDLRANTSRIPSLSRLPADYPRIRSIVTRGGVVTALGRSSIQQPPLARLRAQGSKSKSDALPTELRDQNVIERQAPKYTPKKDN